MRLSRKDSGSTQTKEGLDYVYATFTGTLPFWVIGLALLIPAWSQAPAEGRVLLGVGFLVMIAHELNLVFNRLAPYIREDDRIDPEQEYVVKHQSKGFGCEWVAIISPKYSDKEMVVRGRQELPKPRRFTLNQLSG